MQEENTQNKNTQNNQLIDEAFEKVSKWMNPQELESLLEEEPHLGNLLNCILLRYNQIQQLIESLKEEVPENTRLEKITELDESVQVMHYFYQAALTQSVETYEKIHEKIFLAAEKLNARINGE